MRPHTTRLWGATTRKISTRGPPSGRNRHLCCIAFHSQRHACMRGAALHSCGLYARPRDFNHAHGPSFWPSSYRCHSARPFPLATLDVDLEDSSYPTRCADVGSTFLRRLLSLKLLRPASSRHLSAAPCSSLKQSCHIPSLCSSPSPLSSCRTWRPSSSP